MIALCMEFYATSLRIIMGGEILTIKCPISTKTHDPLQFSLSILCGSFDSSHKHINHEFFTFSTIESKAIETHN